MNPESYQILKPKRGDNNERLRGPILRCVLQLTKSRQMVAARHFSEFEVPFSEILFRV